MKQLQLSFKEQSFMFNVVGCIGTLARTSNIARDFLLQAVEPRFWKTNIAWKTELGERQYTVLASYSLAALAVSESPEFDVIAEKIKADPKAGGDRYSLAGGLVDAQFHKYLIQTKGFDTYRQMTREERSWEFPKWIKTPAGANWYNWSLEVDGLKR